MNKIKLLILLISIGIANSIFAQSPSSYPYPTSITWSSLHNAVQQSDNIVSTTNGSWGHGSFSCNSLASSGGGVSFMLYQNASSQRVIGFANSDPNGYYNSMSTAILVVPTSSTNSTISLLLNGSVITSFGSRNLSSSPLPVSFYINSSGSALVFFGGSFMGQFNINLNPSGLKIATAIERNSSTIHQLKSIATCTPPSVQGQVLNCNTDLDPVSNTTVSCATVSNIYRYSWKITKTGTSNYVTILTTVPSITTQMISNQYFATYASNIFCNDIKITMTPIFPSGYPMTGVESSICNFSVLCNPDIGIFYELKPYLDAGYYTTEGDDLFVVWDEDYLSTINYKYKIYLINNDVIADQNTFTGLDKSLGDNRLKFNFLTLRTSGDLIQNKVYTLEMIDEKNKSYFLKFELGDPVQ